MNLSLSTAKEFVRSRIDELPFDNGDLLNDTLDDRNLGLAVEKHLPEAIRTVHLTAEPNKINEGISLGYGNLPSAFVENGVLDMDFGGMPNSMLRMLSFKCGDSNVVLTNAFPEDSPEGRMQLNKYLRGRPESPVLVRMADSGSNDAYRPHYRYYTTTQSGVNLNFVLRYFPAPKLTGTGDSAYYYISENLYDAVLNTLTGMVLMAYKDSANAEYFFKRAQI